jgi:hypothetical protein
MQYGREPTLIGTVLYTSAMIYVIVGVGLFMIVFGPFIWASRLIERLYGAQPEQDDAD